MTSFGRPSTSAVRMRPAMSSRASSHVTRSHCPPPRGPTRRCGYRMRSGSFTWFRVAGPLAQFRPRLPGCTGLPSNFWIFSVWGST
jgi:hypothetical protein